MSDEILIDSNDFSKLLKIKNAERHKNVVKNLEQNDIGYISHQIYQIELDLRSDILNKQLLEKDFRFLIQIEPRKFNEIKNIAFKLKQTELQISKNEKKLSRLKIKIKNLQVF